LPIVARFRCLSYASLAGPSGHLSAKFPHETTDLFILLVDFAETFFGGLGICPEGDSQDIHPVEVVFFSDFFYLIDDFQVVAG
jgi:hypothetical protein